MSAAPTAKESARSRPRSAPIARRSPIRARGSNTRPRPSAARKARRSKQMSEKAKALFLRRRVRVRRNLRRAANNRPRLSVFRSSKHIYAQIIDDTTGRTLAAASTLDGVLKTNLKTGADIAAASAVGKLVAERAKTAGVEQVVFDRGAYLFHGRVKALADAAREGGLDF